MNVSLIAQENSVAMMVAEEVVVNVVMVKFAQISNVFANQNMRKSVLMVMFIGMIRVVTRVKRLLNVITMDVPMENV